MQTYYNRGRQLGLVCDQKYLHKYVIFVVIKKIIIDVSQKCNKLQIFLRVPIFITINVRRKSLRLPIIHPINTRITSKL